LTYDCDPGDFDRDRDVDCTDFAGLIAAWTGPGTPTAITACASAIPAASTWGLVLFSLLLLAAGTIRLRCTSGVRRDPAGV
jgi:hypothetical protein